MSRPPGHTHEPDRDDGADIAQIYHATDRPEPPAALDQIIREAAARRPRRAHPWRHALSLAAVVVLSAAVLLMLPRERFEHEPEADARRDSVAPLRGLGSDEARKLEQALEKRRSVTAPAADAPGEAGEASAGRTQPAADAPAPAAQRESVRPREEAPAAPAAEAYYRSSPELWIQHIERLLAEGDFDSADAEYQAFRQQHPRHPYAQRR